MRADVPVGIQAAQIIHAAGYSSPGNLPGGTYAVALHVADERELIELAETLARAGLPRHLITEEDPPYAGQAMSIGLLVHDRRAVRPFLRHLPLVGQMTVK